MNNEKFLQDLLARIKPREAEVTKAINRKVLIKQELEKLTNLVVIDSGSFSRETAIHPVHDIDLFVVIEKEAYPKKISELKEYFRRKVQSITSKNKKQLSINENENIPILIVEHGILIKYPRKEPNFLMDIILAIKHESKENWYKIPDFDEINKKDIWIETNKTDHEIALKKANIAYDGAITNFIRIFKFWSLINRKGKKAIKSYLLEQLILDNLPNKTADFSESVIGLFKKLANAIIDDKYKKPPYTSEVLSNLEEKRRNRARENLLRDYKLCNDGKLAEVFNKKIKE